MIGWSALAIGWASQGEAPAGNTVEVVDWRAAIAAGGRWLAWPHVGQPSAAVVMNAPLVALARRALRRRDVTPFTIAVLGLGGWLWVLAIAVAVRRGGEAEMQVGLPSRYVNFCVLLLLTNAAALAGWARQADGITPARCRGAVVAWLLFAGVGWLGESAQAVRRVIIPRLRDRDAPVMVAQAFARSGDGSRWPELPRLLVPHPEPGAVAEVLNDPRLQGHLPPHSMRARVRGFLAACACC